MAIKKKKYFNIFNNFNFVLRKIWNKSSLTNKIPQGNVIALSLVLKMAKLERLQKKKKTAL